ncbi:MAG: MFS transporter [Anaerolineae bacterium]|nr:MFS transporter [Anaerolineae bacterium]
MNDESIAASWQKPFYTIWIGQAFSMVGSALVRFAVIWWLTEETRSPMVLTTATIASMLPMILLSPFTGPLVDRWNRRWVMVISDAMIAILTAGLAVLYALGIAEIWHVYVILFLRSFGDVFQSPAMQASTSLMVPKNQLARVGGMNDTLMGVVNIISPPLGALLVETVSMQGTLAIDLVTALLAIGPLFFIKIPQPANLDAAKRAGFWNQMSEGFHFVWKWQGLAFMFVVLAALLGLIGVGLGSMAFGLIPANAFALGLIVMFFRTAMIPFVRGSVMAIFQTHVPPELQGRVFTLLLASISMMAPFGLALGGPVANAYGVNTIFIITGIGCLGVALVWALNPSILTMESQHKRQTFHPVENTEGV